MGDDASVSPRLQGWGGGGRAASWGPFPRNLLVRPGARCGVRAPCGRSWSTMTREAGGRTGDRGPSGAPRGGRRGVGVGVHQVVGKKETKEE